MFRMAGCEKLDVSLLCLVGAFFSCDEGPCPFHLTIAAASRSHFSIEITKGGISIIYF